MEDENGNKFIVRSGKFSSYGKETVAQGSGKIRGIATIYNSDIQLVFAQTSDYAALTGARFERKVTPASAEGLVVAASEKTYLIKTAEGYEYVFVGEDATHTIKVGDNVLYGKYAGTELDLDGVKYLIMRQSDVLAILG